MGDPSVWRIATSNSSQQYGTTTRCQSTNSKDTPAPSTPPSQISRLQTSSGIRKRILALNLDLFQPLRDKQEPTSIAVDSTGISVHRAGGWVERKHGKKKRYVKLHFAVNTETHEVVAMEITDDMQT